MQYYLTAARLDLEQQVKLGSLILTSDQSHLLHGKFDVDRMMKLLRDAVARAMADATQAYRRRMT